jgi:hypothetical protein
MDSEIAFKRKSDSLKADDEVSSKHIQAFTKDILVLQKELHDIVGSRSCRCARDLLQMNQMLPVVNFQCSLPMKKKMRYRYTKQRKVLAATTRLLLKDRVALARRFVCNCDLIKKRFTEAQKIITQHIFRLEKELDKARLCNAGLLANLRDLEEENAALKAKLASPWKRHF